MAKKLRVKTPQTTDGKTLAYDGNKQVIYTESIVEFSAKKEFESLNATLPEHLKHELEEIDEDEADKDLADKDAKLQSVIAEAEKAIADKAQADKDIADKDAQIAELQKQIEKAAKK